MSKSTYDKISIISWAESHFVRPFTRAEWNLHPTRPVAGSTVTGWFGKWSNFIDHISFKKTKLDEVMEWTKSNFSTPPTREQWDSTPDRPVHSDTIQRWCGWNTFTITVYGASTRLSANPSVDEIKNWIEKSSTLTQNGCWETSGSLSGSGYGRMHYQGKSRGKHVVSYIVFNGDIADGDTVRHTCDNPKCCNPQHLIAGTRSDNTLDYSERDVWRRSPKLSLKRPYNLSPHALMEWMWKQSTVTTGGCMLYHSPHPKSGYGVTKVSGINWQAHRFIRCHIDCLPHDHPLLVRHLCHNRACINPDHLVWGTHRDNRLDDVTAGKNVKITPELRKEIKQGWGKWGYSKTEFDRHYARKYKVSSGTIRNIRIT